MVVVVVWSVWWLCGSCGGVVAVVVRWLWFVVVVWQLWW